MLQLKQKIILRLTNFNGNEMFKLFHCFTFEQNENQIL